LTTATSACPSTSTTWAAPNLLWEGLKFRLGWRIRPPYSMEDMAADTLGVLDALSIAKAHVVGVSMGGMVAQRVAVLAPSRLLSLSSIMSSSGARGLPEASPAVTRICCSAGPPARACRRP
jgi:pimeloyl-ACP methyl ester carboxylesterase